MTEANGPSKGLRKIEPLEKKLRDSPAGAKVADLIDQHAPEVLDLVNKSRRVGVVWQRYQGPRYIRAIMNSGFDDVEIPQAVHGIALEELLLHMADALQRYGTPELRTAIADHSLWVLRWARECSSLDEMFQRLAEQDQQVAA